MSTDDDRGFGHVLSRREALGLLGAAGASALLGSPGSSWAQVPPCVVVPAQMEGPYFVEERLNRSDIRRDPSDQTMTPGVPLRLSLRVSQLTAASICGPLANAVVDVWQCDAIGRYSDVADTRKAFDTRGRKFLRGHQVTDAGGLVEFTTIYPGWYPGRAVHVHFKIRTNPGGSGSDFTSQLYFSEDVTDKVHAQVPYASRGRRSTMNAGDGLYRNGGSQLMLRLSEESSGYLGRFDLALKMSRS
jgi:protocatechuate 3,4-dioxygenase beta subunit